MCGLIRYISEPYLYLFLCVFVACNCDFAGSYGVSCDEQTGQCDCRETFDGLTCDKCKPNFYNYPICEGECLRYVLNLCALRHLLLFAVACFVQQICVFLSIIFI